jgi:sirohydrochlorin ferrochelatase
MSSPTLLAVAHGSRSPAAQEAVGALAERVRLLAPALDVRVAFVQHAEPSLASGLAAAGSDVVVVPLLLSTGYHLAVDLSSAARAAGARLAAPLGPHRGLAAALADHLTAAGVPAGTPVVLAAAGSSDPKAAGAVEVQAAMLAGLRGAEVLAAYATAGTPTVGDAVAALRGRSGAAARADAGDSAPVAVATYLLSPGHFHDRLKQSAATWVSAPLGSHPAVAALVLDRYQAAASRSVAPDRGRPEDPRAGLADERRGEPEVDLGRCAEPSTAPVSSRRPCPACAHWPITGIPVT